MIGATLFDLGDWDAAEPEYQAALALTPDSYVAIEHLAELRSYQRRDKEALGALRPRHRAGAASRFLRSRRADARVGRAGTTRRSAGTRAPATATSRPSRPAIPATTGTWRCSSRTSSHGRPKRCDGRERISSCARTTPPGRRSRGRCWHRETSPARARRTRKLSRQAPKMPGCGSAAAMIEKDSGNVAAARAAFSARSPSTHASTGTPKLNRHYEPWNPGTRNPKPETRNPKPETRNSRTPNRLRRGLD